MIPLRSSTRRGVCCGCLLAVAGCTPSWIEKGFDQALRLQRQGQYEAALERYRGLLREDAELDGALCNIGIIRMQQGRPTQAVIAFRRAIAVNPHNVMGRYLLAVSLWRAGLHDEARMQIERTDSERRRWVDSVRTRHGQVQASLLPDPRIASEAFATSLYELRRASTTARSAPVFPLDTLVAGASRLSSDATSTH
jgi:tetratricopeptide (TPR) repeat protein